MILTNTPVTNSKRAISTVGQRYRQKGRDKGENEGLDRIERSIIPRRICSLFLCTETVVAPQRPYVRRTCSRAKIYDKRVVRIESSFVRVLHTAARLLLVRNLFRESLSSNITATPSEIHRFRISLPQKIALRATYIRRFRFL